MAVSPIHSKYVTELTVRAPPPGRRIVMEGRVGLAGNSIHENAGAAHSARRNTLAHLHVIGRCIIRFPGEFQVALRIRQARLEEGPLLTELTMRSKAHWGYDTAFMAAARADLEFVPERFLTGFHVYILEDDNAVIGFYGLCPADKETVELTHLFVEPQHIGGGHGKQLWEHAVKNAQSLGFRRLILSSDPFAEPFYASQGAVRIGEEESAVRKGRMLPLMEYILRPPHPSP
jgi:N-acetylglutamate synthase-like GNAT family acetyltransferase